MEDIILEISDSIGPTQSIRRRAWDEERSNVKRWRIQEGRKRRSGLGRMGKCGGESNFANSD